MQRLSELSNGRISINRPKKLWLLLIPVIALLLLGTVLMKGDVVYVLNWFLVLFLFGIITLPITFYLFKDFGSGCYMTSKPIGILLTGVVVWTFSYLKLLPFSLVGIIIALVVLGSISYGFKPFRDNFFRKLSQPLVIERIVIEETLFALILVLLCFFKGFNSAINGQEKFMDYGFVMSMMRSTELPAKDMWLSGYNINYYYFGQFLYTMIIKVSSITPEAGYNLAICSSLGIPFMLAFVIGTQLVESASQYNYLGSVKVFRYVVGILSGFTTMIFGNSHSFFYDENSFGNRFLSFFSDMGINVGTTDAFFYPNSTRFIGHNPDSRIVDAAGNIISQGDYTIHEFPFYSYLLGDLHAHYISMMIVLVIVSICIAIVARATSPDNKSLALYAGYFSLKGTRPRIISWLKNAMAKEKGIFLNIYVIGLGLFLGCAMMCNYWDFLIYFAFYSMTLLIVNIKRTPSLFGYPTGIIGFVFAILGILTVYLKFSSNIALHLVLQVFVLAIVFIFNCIRPSAFSRTGVGMSLVFCIANLVALPFNANFDMISNMLGLVKNRTSLYQFLIVWGTSLFICAVFIVFTIVFKNHLRSSPAMQRSGITETPIFEDPSSGYSNPLAKFIGQRNIIDVFVCGMSVVAFIMIIAPEIFYVRDIYTSGYLRANTMFKFTFAAFIIFGLVIAYAVTRMFIIVKKDGKLSNVTFIFGLVCCVLLLIPANYSLVSLSQRCGEITLDNYKTLNGLAYIEEYTSSDALIYENGNLAEYGACAQWFNENVEGQPTICEAYGYSYSDNCIISSYTGLPTVCGWQTHEWLWRFHGILDEESDTLVSDPNHDIWNLFLTPRHTDITTLYTTNDPSVARSMVYRYGIEYIVCGDLEFKAFGCDNTQVLLCIGEQVYTNGTLMVIHVTPEVAE